MSTALAHPIKGVRFENARRPGLKIDCLTRSRLMVLMPREHFAKPERPDFHLLMLCTEGSGSHSVDFQQLEIQIGTVILVRPGQVQQFDPEARMESLIVAFAPDFLLPFKPADPSAGAVGPHPALQLESDCMEPVAAAFQEIHREYAETDGSILSVRLLQLLVHALLVRLQCIAERQAVETASASRMEVFRLFQSELEQRFQKTREVAEYAQRLGYASATLNRATLDMAGMTAKEFIDGRVVLEGKRLLAHTDLSVARIATYLGFSEATNFAKFFKRGSRTGPREFRSSIIKAR